MKPVSFSAKAVEDLKSICDYIRRDNPLASDQVRHAIFKAAEQLGSHPELAALINPKPRHQGVRMFLVREYKNYLLIYRIESEGVLVLRVLHAAQDWTRFFR
jgi:addiction module RelE/StbE family toxin